MDNRSEARDFLASRRARLTPQQAGLTRSEDFRTRWAARNVRSHRTGTKKLHHPVVGDLDLTYEATELSAGPGLTLLIYTAELGSSAQDSLNLLAPWSATLDQLHERETMLATELLNEGSQEEPSQL